MPQSPPIAKPRRQRQPLLSTAPGGGRTALPGTGRQKRSRCTSRPPPWAPALVPAAYMLQDSSSFRKVFVSSLQIHRPGSLPCATGQHRCAVPINLIRHWRTPPKLEQPLTSVPPQKARWRDSASDTQPACGAAATSANTSASPCAATPTSIVQ